MSRKRDSDYDRPDWREIDKAREKAELEELLKYEPSNVECEAALLGALMLDNRITEFPAVRKLRPAHFYEALHARIFERIMALVKRDKLATPITLRPYFDGEKVDWGDGPEPLAPYLAKLTGSGAAMIGAAQFAEQIFDLAMMRATVQAAREVAEAAIRKDEEPLRPRALMQLAEQKFSDIAMQVEGPAEQNSRTFSESWDETFAEMEDVGAGKVKTGIEIAGYDDWNAAVGAMEPKDLVIVGARPSMGKSAVACKVAKGAALAGHATELLILESDRKKVTRRMIADEMFEEGVTSSYQDLKKGRMTAADRAAIARARARIDALPFRISDPASMVVEDVLPFILKAQRYWRKKGTELKLVVLDYLGRLGTAKEFRSPNERVTYISNMLKAAAQATGIVLLVLSQLSRDLDKREDKRPVMSDLRDSGSIEQDADVIAFIHREEYYIGRSEPPKSNEKKWAVWQDEMIATRNRMELYSAKVREGAPTKRTGYFFTEYQAIRDSRYYSARPGAGGFDFDGLDRPG